MFKDIQPNNNDPVAGNEFAYNFVMLSRERKSDTRFDPSAPALIEIARLVYANLVADNTYIWRTLLPEYFDYYATALLWFRMISLKVKLRQQLTQAEKDILFMIENTQFSVPEPVMIQLRSIGQIQTMTGEHLTPTIPDLPQRQVAGHGGYYGDITLLTHNLYEEIPCLGVLSEAVRHAISNAPPGAYASALARIDLTPNKNLLGFRILGYREIEAKNMAYYAGITEIKFPESPANTGLNMRLINSISSVIAQTKTFKLTTICINSLPKTGSLIQAIIQRPEVPKDNRIIEKLADISTTSMTKEHPSIFGASIMYCPQLIKISETLDNAWTWCCVDQTPQEWIDNRNDRRSIPARYQAQVFQCISQNGEQHRITIIEQMLLTKC